MLPPAAHEPFLQAFLSDPEEVVIAFRLDGTIFLWNRTAELLYGFSSSEVVGKCIKFFVPPHELPSLNKLLRNPQLIASRTDGLAERLNKSGVPVSVRLRRALIPGPEGDVQGILERARISSPCTACSVAETHLHFLVEQMPLFFWTTDQHLRVTSHWGRSAHLGHKFPRHPVGQPIHRYLRCRDESDAPIKQHQLALRGISSRFEYVSRNRIYDLSIEPYRDPQARLIGCIGMALDVTERKKTEEEIRYRAAHDGLTGLANYRQFFENLENEVRRAGRSRQPFALLLLDLDDLKTINDRLGHLTGNQALNRLARVMKEQCRATETAARYGGDEFAILLIDADARRAQAVAERIRTALRSQTDPPQLSVSIGFSVYPEDGFSAQDLLEAADKRLYQSKKSRHPLASSTHAEHSRTAR